MRLPWDEAIDCHLAALNEANTAREAQVRLDWAYQAFADRAEQELVRATTMQKTDMGRRAQTLASRWRQCW